MPLPPETRVHRALLKNSSPTIEAFKLRPARTGTNGPVPPEDSLSLAKTETKARGTLKCKGCICLTVGDIESIPGLSVQIKRLALQDNPEQPDEDMLEVMGLPMATD